VWVTVSAMRRWPLVLFGALMLLVPACGGTEGPNGSREDYPREGDKAPGFSLPSAEGSAVSVADFRGKQPVLLYFSMGPG